MLFRSLLKVLDESLGETDPTADSVGAVMVYTGLSTLSKAEIQGGALVKADRLDVDARTFTSNVLVGAASGASTDTGMNGVVTTAVIGNTTLARVASGAKIETLAPLNVYAADDLINISAGGGITEAKSMGAGLTLGVNVITRNTQALIGDTNVLLGDGRSAPGTGVNASTDTVELGYAHGFSTGDLVRYTDTGTDSAISGLVDGDRYFVRAISPTAIQLGRSAQAAAGTAPAFGVAAVNSANDSIALGYEHGFKIGRAHV